MELMKKPSKELLATEASNNAGVEEHSLEDAIENLGFGKFQVLLTLGTGFLLMADSMEMVVNSILSPILVCEWNLRSSQEAMISTVVFIGQAIGSIGWGYVSDRYGRKLTLCVSAAIVFILGVVSSQVPSYWLMLFCRCLVGLGIGGVSITVAVLTECMPVQQRSKSVLLLQVFWGTGSIFEATLAIGVVNTWGWRYYLLIISSPVLAFLIVVSWWIPESLRYLLISGQMDTLNKTLQRIAETNKKDAPEKVDVEVVVPSRGRILDLFTEKFRLTSMLLFVMWFTTGFCYYGIGLLTTQMFQTGINGCHPGISRNATVAPEGCRRLTNTDYTDVMTTSASEIPALIIIFLITDRIGRKLCLTIEYGVGCVSVLALLFCQSRTLLIIFIFIFRGALSNSFATIYLYTAEVFPTNIRSVSMGCCTLVARFGSMIAPFESQVLIQKSFFAVVAVYAIMLFLSMCSSLLLRKETTDLALEDSSAVAPNNHSENYQTFE